MSKIEWTEKTWNPIIGCRRVSEGCRNCYAETMAGRIARMGGKSGARYSQVVKHGSSSIVIPKRPSGLWSGDSVFVPEVLAQPLGWRKPRTVIVCSMSDLFFEGHTNEQIAAVFGVMAATPQHTYQVLTKRPQRALQWFDWLGTMHGTHAVTGERVTAATDPLAMVTIQAGKHARLPSYRVGTGHPVRRWPLPNVHLGVSVEDQQRADERIPLLMRCPAAVRFVSYEPALGPVDFRNGAQQRWSLPTATDARGNGIEWTDPGESYVPIDWIIIGGESGSGARPFNLKWARDVIRQCEPVGCKTAVFVKQFGAAPYLDRLPEWHENGGGSWSANISAHSGRFNIKLNDRKGGDMSEWPPDLRVRQMPKVVPG